MESVVDSKQCRGCGLVLPLGSFYAHPFMADGRLNHCKECKKQSTKTNYRQRRPQYVAYDAAREQTPERKAFKSRARRKHAAKHPEKYRARKAVARAVRAGRLVRQPCSRCQSTISIHAHHEDYSKPLDVTWLCKNCHWKEHGAVF